MEGSTPTKGQLERALRNLRITGNLFGADKPTAEHALDRCITASDVDVEALKKYSSGADRSYRVGWNDCIDHLARLGLLRTPATGGWQDKPMPKPPSHYDGGQTVAWAVGYEQCLSDLEPYLPAAPQSNKGGRDAG